MARQSTLAILLLLPCCVKVFADDPKPDHAKLIIGKWMASEVDPGTVPKGSFLIFSANGTMRAIPNDNPKEDILTGTYSIEGNTITYKLKVGGVEHSQKLTIRKLTIEHLEISDGSGMKATFMRYDKAS